MLVDQGIKHSSTVKRKGTGFISIMKKGFRILSIEVGANGVLRDGCSDKGTYISMI